jgi:hypothetical protein
VTRSKALPGTILCTVSSRIDEGAAGKLIDALLAIQKTPSGAEALKSLRMTQFERADPAALDALLKAAGDRPGSGR